ncbi:Protein phosphatase 1 regulatory subunit 21 [Collichthys lucidus]|uniref:Protein phosphatase 1 regulatory subunit 21 n=1 Tax=Collichthys lucidus TaxID=240159 RepID=A0A4U5VC11_COLLU|nr:Protein phosphatase 1 regulatory subunit 21 [Collichthys lucidus]
MPYFSESSEQEMGEDSSRCSDLTNPLVYFCRFRMGTVFSRGCASDGCIIRCPNDTLRSSTISDGITFPSTMANVTDLQTKYSKLAQEYSKLRAQNQVLKKAVVDEQANSLSLKEQLKQRDQSLRKQEQEMDSLSFRNQQLAKRVELLQEELAVSEAKGKKGKSKGDSPPQHGLETQNVFDEDLQKKIEENERLHIQFYEADEKHRRQEAELKTRLQELEKDSEQHQAVVDGLTTKYMESIERLQGDKARLEVKAQTLEREAKECRMRTEECQQQLRRCQTELNRQVKQSSSVIQEKVPFNDTKFSDYNSLNVPPHNRRHQLKARDVAGQALGFIQDLVAALLNFHSYTEQRVHIYPLDSSIETISPLNQKFSQYLHENAAYVRPLEDSFLQLHQSITEDTVTVLETVVKLKTFADHFSSYTHFLQKILPYQLKSLEEECEAPLCTAALTAKNQELQSDMKRVTSVFEKLQNYINILALPSVRQDAVPQSSTSAVFTQLAACLHSLNDAIKGESTIATFFSNNLDFFTSPGYSPRGSTVALNPLQAESMLANKKKAAAYIHAIKKPRPQSVPYREALSNRRILNSSTESREGLTQQRSHLAKIYNQALWTVQPRMSQCVSRVYNNRDKPSFHKLTVRSSPLPVGLLQVQQSQEKIARLEQEKEHWLLEAQLGKVRLEKENQRIADLEAQLAAALGGSPNLQASAASTLAQSHEEADREQKAAGKETTLCTSLVGDEESREQLIKTHYMARVGELTTQLQISDSKAVHFHSECRALAKRLAIAEKSREALSEEVKVANQNITRLQDELTTTKRSYEDQLSMMSDHLCSMNETLSKQKEEIDTLKLGSKSAAAVVVSKELVLSETCAKYDKSSDNLTQDYQNKGAEPDPEAGLRVRDVGLDFYGQMRLQHIESGFSVASVDVPQSRAASTSKDRLID